MLIKEKKDALDVARLMRISYLRFLNILKNYMRWIAYKKNKIMRN